MPAPFIFAMLQLAAELVPLITELLRIIAKMLLGVMRWSVELLDDVVRQELNGGFASLASNTWKVRPGKCV